MKYQLLFARLIEKTLHHPALLRWEFIDHKIELHKKQCRIQFIDQVLPKNGIGAELGVFKGHLSPLLLQYTRATKLHLIDSWYFRTAFWKWAGGNQSTVDGLIKVLRTFKQEIEAARVLVHVGDDLQVLATFPDAYFDWVYIDTSHTYDHTLRELRLLAEKVKRHGVIGGDDWQPDSSHKHHGVYQAIQEFIAAEAYRVIYANRDNQQWAIQKR